MRKRQLDSRYILLISAALIILVVVIYPLWQVFYRSFIFEGVYSLRNYQKALIHPTNLKAMINSLWISVLTTILCIVSGTILAFLVVRTDLPYKRHMRSMLILPYAIPPFFGAIAWTQLIGPQGYLTNPILDILGLEAPFWNIYSSWGVVFVSTIHFFPFVFITVAGALERMDASLEEVARTSGASTYRIMRDITIPLVFPAILAGGLLAFIGCIANFGIPALLGMRARFFVLTTRIYYALSIPDFPLATAMSISLIIVSGVALLLHWNIQKKEGQYTVIAGKSVRPSELKIGKMRPIIMAGVIFFIFIIFILPVFSIFLTALLKYWGAPIALKNLTFEHFVYIFHLDLGRRAMVNSLFLSAASATLVMILGTVISYLNIKVKFRGSHILDFLGTIPYAVPHTVIAIAMILAWAKPPLSLYGTLWIILVAYLAGYLPFSIRTTSATLHQIHDSLEEAARVSGAKPLITFKDIVLPLVKPGMVAGWILVFMPAFRELTMSILLYSHGTETIGVVVYNMQDAGYTQIAAALACVVLVVIVLGNAVMRRLARGVSTI